MPGRTPPRQELRERGIAQHDLFVSYRRKDSARVLPLVEALRAEGGLPGARGLQQQVLDTFRRILGDEHPDTSIAAWNLIAGTQPEPTP